MNNYIKLKNMLATSTGSDVTPLQEMILFINLKACPDDFDFVNFITTNNFNLTIDTIRLLQYGSLLEEYYTSLSEDEKKALKENSIELYNKLNKYEKNLKNAVSIGGR